MQYLIAIVFIIVFSVFDNSLGFCIGSPFYTHFTYMFQHASVMHLVLTSFSFIAMFRVLTIFANKYKLFLALVIIGFISSYFSECQLPTVGASSMVYGMIGMMYGFIWNKILEFMERSILILNLVGLLIALLISCFTKNSNFSIHLISALIGLLVGVCFAKHIKK